MSDKVTKTTQRVVRSSVSNIFPFTGGLFVIYAFFWPQSYGHWLGTIVDAFINSATTNF